MFRQFGSLLPRQILGDPPSFKTDAYLPVRGLLETNISWTAQMGFTSVQKQ